MLNKATYTNHLNQTIEFGSGGIFLNDSEFYDYEWLYDSDYNEITNFHKGVTKKNATIIIAANEEEGLNIRNRIYEVFERDILAETPGKLEINGYYTSCYFNASKKSNYYYCNGYMVLTVNIISDSSDWITEKEFMFLKNDATQDDKKKEYEYSYPYTYSSYAQSNSVVNPFFVESDFRLRIYGDVTNPSITIGSHVYQINTSIEKGQRVEIDSNKRTIKLIKQNGSIENRFWEADKKSYIFEKIPTGENAVQYDGTFGFDLILLDRRSEPGW